ncbi:hypothetical protein HHK36_011895 [Tetracentron sinense]|uniref:Peptidase M16 C-terminal domain-containing protein n=1 Tax=Tetracentron sinense TaxID=13715 RepID=A0A835DKW0_TETSI|nr:hypothetical protein HHK36_011895 [Tetracentron sinense]
MESADLTRVKLQPRINIPKVISQRKAQIFQRPFREHPQNAGKEIGQWISLNRLMFLFLTYICSGNWDTLEVRPKARGLDTRHELIKFYEENYSANLMHLVVYGKESLDKIQSLVEYKFQEIRNTDRSCFHFPGQPCTPEHLQIIVKVVPIKEGHKLRVIWPITPDIRHYKEGPCRMFSHLDTSKICAGWATSLSAGEGDWTSEFSFFKVLIDLTDAGHEHVNDIIGLLFKYILLLQQSGVNKWIFDEAYSRELHNMDATIHGMGTFSVGVRSQGSHYGYALSFSYDSFEEVLQMIQHNSVNAKWFYKGALDAPCEVAMEKEMVNAKWFYKAILDG